MQVMCVYPCGVWIVSDLQAGTFQHDQDTELDFRCGRRSSDFHPLMPSEGNDFLYSPNSSMNLLPSSWETGYLHKSMHSALLTYCEEKQIESRGSDFRPQSNYKLKKIWKRQLLEMPEMQHTCKRT